MKTYARFIVLIVSCYILIRLLLLKRDVSSNLVSSKYMRYALVSGGVVIHDSQYGGVSSEHPKTYKEVYLKHLSSKRIAETNYTEGEVIETLPANETGRLFGIKAGKLVKVLRSNGSVEVEQRIEKYRLIRKLGEGGFGKVYLGTDIRSGESVAIKLEYTKKIHSHLYYEEGIYRILNGTEGFPVVRWSGRVGGYNVIVTDLLGPSLRNYFKLCKSRFSLKTILLIADQLICRLEYLHSIGFINRDVKPQNVLVGLGTNSHLLHSIDFGLSTRYRNQDNEHVPYSDNAKVVGTTKYASINTQLGIQQSRRDDMESLGYVLMYFLRGKLPWDGLHISSKRKKHEKILQIKQSVRIDDLCKGHQPEFAIYLKECRSLGFDEEPDYFNLRLLFSDLLKRQNLTSNNMFDWHVADGRCNIT